MGFFSQMGLLISVCIIHVLIYGLMTLVRGFSRQDLKEIKITSDFVGVTIAWAAVLFISGLIGLLNQYLDKNKEFDYFTREEKKEMVSQYRKSKRLEEDE